jgi:hypothetical protein
VQEKTAARTGDRAAVCTPLCIDSDFTNEILQLYYICIDPAI